MHFGFKIAPPMYQRMVGKTFKDYLDDFMKFFLDDFMVFSDLDTHFSKLQRCFEKCGKYETTFNLGKLCLHGVFGDDPRVHRC
jgi:hypothetical protein